MGEYVERVWEPRPETFGLSRRDRAGGTYLAFIPSKLGKQGPEVSAAAFSVIADAQSALTRADGIVGESGLYLNHLLLRSESIASSQIEGHVISPRKLALADVLGRGKSNAIAVIQNLRAMEYAIDVVAQKWDLEIEDVIELQQTIMPHLERGFRTEQNWIQGPGNSPLRAAFVPPPEEYVAPLMQDLLEYVNESDHPPLLKAAIAHAQFETIHPFVDGNGRTGRALIHAILKRDGITERAVLPISTVFSTSQDHYIEGLTAFREEPPQLDQWVEEFSRSAVRAAGNVITLKERANELDALLRARHREWRAASGLPAEPRAGATVERVRSSLMSRPVSTVASVSEEFGVSRPAAERALDELASARVVTVSKNHRGETAAFVSDEHLALVTLTERSNAAGGWDTADEVSASQLAMPQSTLRWNANGRLAAPERASGVQEPSPGAHFLAPLPRSNRRPWDGGGGLTQDSTGRSP